MTVGAQWAEMRVIIKNIGFVCIWTLNACQNTTVLTDRDSTHLVQSVLHNTHLLSHLDGTLLTHVDSTHQHRPVN